MAFFNFISSLGSMIMVPIIIFIVGLIFRNGLAKSLRSGITVGVGFIGLNLVLDLLFKYVGPATDILVKKFNLSFSVIDAGWPAAAAVAFGTKIGALIIPFILIVNVVLLVTKLTKTVNVDIWNYWHYAFTGTLVSTITGSLTYGFIAAAAHAAISLKIADISAPKIKEVIGVPGVSIPQAFAASTVPVFILLDKLYDKIPGLKDIKADAKTINEKLGIFGEPMIIGFILGILFGLIVNYDIKGILEMAFAMAGIMLLLPRMVKIIMEGLVPISESAREFLQRRFSGSEFYIGLDSAITVGHPTTIAVGILLIPIVLILASILPNNTTLPLADLASTAFFVCMATPIHKGNFLRILISGTIMMAIVLLLSSAFAPIITQSAIETGFAFPKGAQAITALSAGNIFAWIISKIMSLKIVGAIIIILLVLAFLIISKKYEDKKLVESTNEKGMD
jgi:PTS system galactitol-specific IIC component